MVRDWTYGAAVGGKVFIAGGINAGEAIQPCEVYDPATNVWQFISNFKCFDFRPKDLRNLLSIDGNLYALLLVSVGKSGCRVKDLHLKIEGYDPEEDEWNLKTEIAISVCNHTFINACSVRVFKGFLDSRLLESCVPDFVTKSTMSCGYDKNKCSVM